VESRFMPDAVSNKDAKGLMQILPSTARWAAEKMGIMDFEEAMLMDSEINIRIGCWYLGFLASQFPDNWELVLASYNGGIGNVRKWLSNKEYSRDGQRLDHIPFQETRNYVVRVLEAYEIYKGLYPSLDDHESN
jgi:soluble lytic murein transglycosylase